MKWQVDYPTKRQYTYRQLKEYSIKVASALYKQGYRSGDVIASFTINLPEFTILFAAASALGVAISPVNPSYTACNHSFFASLSVRVGSCGLCVLVVLKLFHREVT